MSGKAQYSVEQALISKRIDNTTPRKEIVYLACRHLIVDFTSLPSDTAADADSMAPSKLFLNFEIMSSGRSITFFALSTKSPNNIPAS